MAAWLGWAVRALFRRRQHDPATATTTPGSGLPSRDDLGPPASILASRLAVPDPSPPTLAELRLDAAKTAAFEWQSARSYATWNELAAAQIIQERADWIPAIHGILGVVGEQVLVAVEAEIEKAILSRRLAALPVDADVGARAAHSRALRFFAEGQANTLVVAGHGVANLVLRTLALDPSFALPKDLSIKAADFTPKSHAQSSWLSLTTGIAQKLLAATSSFHYRQEMQALAQEVVDLAADPSFDDLVKLRNTQYHRWRGESPGVTGINWGGAMVWDQVNQGQAVGIGQQTLPAYTEGQGVLDDLVRMSRAGLDSLVASMPGILAAWSAAFSRVMR